MTIQSFRDIGFTITAVPEPTSLSLAGFSAVAFLGSRVWRKRRPPAFRRMNFGES
ncbi:MAG: PEP-CTERM sorting domain-containing protein [Pirellulales bacterium]